MTNTLYAQPVQWMIVEIVFIPLAWTIVLRVLDKRQRSACLLNEGLLLAGAMNILFLTLLNRTMTARIGDMGLPFQLIHSALFGRRETIRSLLLNILLFTPFGAALSHMLPLTKNIWKRVLQTGVAAMLFSIVIEICQFALSLGNAEADDVICNTLGALIGALSLPLKECFDRRRG